MKHFTIAVLICVLFAFAATAQTTTLPTYVGAGAAFNQIGTPKVNPWATAIYPVASSVGMFGSTTTDIVPVLRFDAAAKRNYYAFTTSIRQGVHKLLITSGKFSALLGGDAGVGLNQASPSGVNVGFSGSFTATGVWSLSNKWAVVVPVRGLWVNSSWNIVPQVGILFKP